MAAVADELGTRFDPYWKDPLLEKKYADDVENDDKPAENGDFSSDQPQKQENNDDSSPEKASKGGFRGGRGGRGRGGFQGRGSNRGRGGFRGNRGGYNQGCCAVSRMRRRRRVWTNLRWWINYGWFIAKL